MGIIYLAALIVGVGSLALQLFMGGGDADGDVSMDAEADVGDVEVEGGGGGEADAGNDGPGGYGFLPIFLSLRFWLFGLLGFGLVGAVLHYLELAAPWVTAVVAIALGLISGTLASWVFRALARDAITSEAGPWDAVGQVGKVLIPVAKGRHGKVRLQVKGQTLDLLATTDEAELQVGDLVLVEEVREGQAHVSRAPTVFLGDS